MTDFILNVQSISTPLLDRFFLTISALTGEFVYLIVLGIVYWCINKEKAYYIGTFLILSFSSNSLLKNIFRVPRPYTYSLVKQIDTATGYGYSFPSGHAQMSTAFSGLFSTVFKKRWMYILGIILVFLTGFSRIYLGVHTPLDILAGIVVGCLIIFLANKLKNINHKLLMYLAFILLFTTSLIFPEEDNLKLLCFVAGFILGNIIDGKYIKYEIPKKILPKISGACIGIAIVVASYLILKAFNLTYTRYFIVGIIITSLIPWIIKKLDKKGGC